MAAFRHLVLTAMLLAASFMAWGSLTQAGKAPEGPPLKLSLAVNPVVYSGLIAIADEKGFFRESGLEVSIREFPSGKTALDALIRGEAEMATVADVAFTGKMNGEPPLRTVGSIGSTKGIEVLARRDGDIDAPSDLKGKRIGVSLDTAGEYYLNKFLLMKRVPPSEVTIVNIAADELAKSFAAGEVHAICAWEAITREAEKGLDGNTVSWPAQNTQSYFWLLAVTHGREGSPETRRMLAAMRKAEEFVIHHEGEARDIVMRRWKFDDGFMRRYWATTRLSLTLDQSLVINLEDAAAWRLKQNPGQAQRVADVTQFIHAGPLESINPGALTIFR